MKTSKPFSTISYNTTEYLALKLDELVSKNKLLFYAFIKHYKEEDEKKDHIHLLIFPNGQIETDAVYKVLEEYDPLNPDKPLRCRIPHKCNSFGDWYLYGLHDKNYLLAHGLQSRKHHYKQNDFITSDEDEFDDMIHQIDYTKMYKNQRFFEAIENGYSLEQMVKENIIPMPQYSQYRNLYFDMTNNVIDHTIRNEYETTSHDPVKPIK